MLCERSVSRLEYKSPFYGWRGIVLALIPPLLILTIRLVFSQPITGLTLLVCVIIFAKLMYLRPSASPDVVADLTGYRLILKSTAYSNIVPRSGPYEISYQRVTSLRPQSLLFGLLHRPIAQTTDGETYPINYFLSFSRRRVLRIIDEITRFMSTGRPATQ